MGKTLDFEYYEEDRLCTKVHVDYKTQKVDVVNYTDDIVSQAFGRRNVTIDTIDEFFRERVFPETRVDKDKLLEAAGMTHFDAEAIARKTHGILMEDLFWIRFAGEDITYEDIKKLRVWK